MHVEKLKKAKTVQVPGGSVTATHVGYAFVDQSAHNGVVISHAIHGIVDPATGRLIPLSQHIPDEVVEIRDTDSAKDLTELLAANAQGKPAGRFRDDDVAVLHKKVKAR
jgi:hypothetical protein